MNLAKTETRPAQHRLHRPLHLPWRSELSEHSRAATLELWQDYVQRDERERRERERALVEKVEQRREEFRQALGGEAYAALGRLKADFRLELRHKRRLPHGLNMSYEDVKDAWNERLKGLASRFDLRPEMVKEPIADLFKDVAKLTPHAERFADYVYDHVEADPGPPENPWVTYRAPFDGWQSGWDHGALADFGIGRTELLNTVTGQVGNILSLNCSDAANLSLGSLWADTQVVVWYKAPVTGLVEVNIVAHCGEARHFLHVIDEWGVSDYFASQNSYLMMHAIHAGVRGPTYGLVSALNAKGEYSTYRDEQHILPGETVSVTLASDSPVAAGDAFAIRAGSRSDDGVLSNDMEVYSKTTFSWFLSAVKVRIKP